METARNPVILLMLLLVAGPIAVVVKMTDDLPYCYQNENNQCGVYPGQNSPWRSSSWARRAATGKDFA